MKSVLSLKLIFSIILMIAASLHANGRPGPDDVKVTVALLGDIKGQFYPDEKGQGGIASLHTALEKKRSMLAFERGRLLLFHTGTFTDASDNSSFEKSIFTKDFNLPLYMKFDGMLVSEKEEAWLDKSELKKDLNDILFQKSLLSPKKPHSVKVISFENIQIVLAVSMSPEDLEEYFIKNYPKAALYIVLDPNGKEFSRRKPNRVNLTEADSVSMRTILLRNGPMNYKRNEMGTHICSTQGSEACLIDIVIRSGKILSTSNRFYQVNSRNEPGSYQEKDPEITQFLGKITK